MASILAVDDSYVNQEVLRSTLEPFGYRVTIAASVQEGLVLARQFSFDLILSDLHLPDQDGFMFIRSIKSDPWLCQIPFAFLSSSVWGERDRQAGLGLGAVRFILRPIEPQQLLEEIEICLSATSGR